MVNLEIRYLVAFDLTGVVAGAAPASGMKVSQLENESILDEMLAGDTPVTMQGGVPVTLRQISHDTTEVAYPNRTFSGYATTLRSLRVIITSALHNPNYQGDKSRLLLCIPYALAFTSSCAVWRISRIGIITRTNEEAVQAAFVLLGNSTHNLAGIRFWVARDGIIMATGSRQGGYIYKCDYEVKERHSFELFSKTETETLDI